MAASIGLRRQDEREGEGEKGGVLEGGVLTRRTMAQTSRPEEAGVDGMIHGEFSRPWGRRLRRRRPSAPRTNPLHGDAEGDEVERLDKNVELGEAPDGGDLRGGAGGSAAARQRGKGSERERVRGEREGRARGCSFPRAREGGPAEGAAEGRHGDGSGSEATVVHKEDGNFAKTPLALFSSFPFNFLN